MYHPTSGSTWLEAGSEMYKESFRYSWFSRTVTSPASRCYHCLSSLIIMSNEITWNCNAIFIILILLSFQTCYRSCRRPVADRRPYHTISSCQIEETISSLNFFPPYRGVDFYFEFLPAKSSIWREVDFYFEFNSAK